MVGMEAELGPYSHSLNAPRNCGIALLSSEAAADALGSPLAFCAGGPTNVDVIISAACRFGVVPDCVELAAGVGGGFPSTTSVYAVLIIEAASWYPRRTSALFVFDGSAGRIVQCSLENFPCLSSFVIGR